MIVNAAEQAPVEATPGQVAQAEAWLVAKATGAGTRSGRGMDAKRLRQAARRMFATIDHDLADRHEAILLGREARSAESETFLALHDNGDGSFSGTFRIPELHGHLLKSALDRLTAPRRLSRDRHGDLVRDESALGHDHGASADTTTAELMTRASTSDNDSTVSGASTDERESGREPALMVRDMPLALVLHADGCSSTRF